MSSRRTLILIGALVAGAVAALLIFQYVGGIEEKAQGDAQMVSVVIAKADIKKGAVANDLIATKQIDIGQRRQVELPANRITRPEEIKGQIAQIDLTPGMVITSSMFQADAALTNSVSTALKPGMVAVTTSTDQVKAVAGLITQGDYVNLTVVGSCKLDPSGKTVIDGGTASGGGSGDSASGGATGSNAPATFGCGASLYQKVRILGIGRSLGTGVSTPVATPGEATPATTVAPTSDLITFEVPQEAAQIIQLSGPGSLYLTLVRKDYQPHPLPMTSFLPLPGVDGNTPYGADPETQTAGQ
ncbi:MAG: Flp pilus assembly protein CpaB [Acidimicrobiales bacterium]